MEGTAQKKRPRVGSYIVDRDKPIGAGSFASVFRGNHAETGEIVAVKVVDHNRLNKKLKDNLEVEIHVGSMLAHTNIVRLEAIERPVGDRYIYLVMEFCAGGDLSHFLKKRGGRIPESTARAFLRQVAEGLNELQGLNLIHRDLKPHNLLLTEDTSNATVKIADFGFARIIEPSSMAETVCGSPLYMAPEVLSSNKYDIKADLWSIGTILFQMLCGSTPYDGDNHIHLLDNIRKKQWTIPPDIEVKTSAECKDLLKGLLQKNPKERITHSDFMAHPFLGFQPQRPGAALRAATGHTVSPPPGSAAQAASPPDGASGQSPPTPGTAAKKSSPGLPPRLPAAPPADPWRQPGAGEATGTVPLPSLKLERETSSGSDDEFVLIGTPPATPPLRVAWRGAEVDGDGVKLVRQNSMPEGFADLTSKVEREVTNIMELSVEDEDEQYLTSQATVVMELANAMVQHNPRDALALYVKSLKLLDHVIQSQARPGHEKQTFIQCGDDAADEEPARLFMEVWEKAEALTQQLPPAQQGLTAEEILYECALAMGREAASCELLNDRSKARKHYGCAFVCLNLLRAESKVESDKRVLDKYISQVEARARELADAPIRQSSGFEAS